MEPTDRSGTLRALGLALAGAEEGIACEGTALEKRTLKVRGKAFLFLNAREAMFKLEASLPRAAALAQKHPDCVKVGKTGWVTVSLNAKPATNALLKSWLVESHELMASARPKKGR